MREVDIQDPNRFRQVAAQMAERYGVDPELYVRLIERESGFDPMAKGSSGELGLAQIMADTARNPGFGVTPLQNRADPFDNLRFGAEYLGALVKYYDGDMEKALMAYNGGAGNVDKGRPSEAAKEYASSIIPQESDARADKELDRMLAELLASPKTPKARARPDFKRIGKSSRMSPLSGGSDPMRKMMQQAMTPGGIESLYKKT